MTREMALSVNDLSVGDQLNVLRGVRTGSRLNFSAEKLVSIAWTLSERESFSDGRKRIIVSFVEFNLNVLTGNDYLPTISTLFNLALLALPGTVTEWRVC